VQPARPRLRDPELAARLVEILALEVVLLEQLALLVGQPADRLAQPPSQALPSMRAAISGAGSDGAKPSVSAIASSDVT